MFRISTFIWLVLATVSGALLFSFGQKTEDARHDIARLEKQIRQEKQNIDILEAEWSYLNRPSRLRELAEKHLELSPPSEFPVIEDENVALLDKPPAPVDSETKTGQPAADKQSQPAPTPAPVADYQNTIDTDPDQDQAQVEAEDQDRARFALSVSTEQPPQPETETETVKAAPDETIQAVEPQKSFDDVLKSIGIE